MFTRRRIIQPSNQVGVSVLEYFSSDSVVRVLMRCRHLSSAGTSDLGGQPRSKGAPFRCSVHTPAALAVSVESRHRFGMCMLAGMVGVSPNLDPLNVYWFFIPKNSVAFRCACLSPQASFRTWGHAVDIKRSGILTFLMDCGHVRMVPDEPTPPPPPLLPHVDGGGTRCR